MKHFNNHNQEKKESLFLKQPQEFNRFTDKKYLQYALGSLLYMPGDKEDIGDIIVNKKYPEVTAMSWCLEDALVDDNLTIGEENIFIQLEKIYTGVYNEKIDEKDIPLIFVRVRDVEQLRSLTSKMKKHPNKEILKYLVGFIFPKFTSETAISYLDTITIYNKKAEYPLYVMPILESGLVMFKETRIVELMRILSILTKESYNDIVLNIRLGATDFSSLYGLRRSIDYTIYDISVIRDVITDIINVFGRSKDKFIISGPVWEYFNNNKDGGNRMFATRLRRTPFKNNIEQRDKILGQAIDGLIKETSLDKINGLCGKTTIHPSHVKYINSLQVVTEEEYKDALAIINSNGSGVMKSESLNKMNEIKPHTSWANSIIDKAEIYGVIKEGVNHAELF